MSLSAKKLINNAKHGIAIAFGASALFMATNSYAQNTVVEKEKLQDDAYRIKKQKEIKAELSAYLGDEEERMKEAGFKDFKVELGKGRSGTVLYIAAAKRFYDKKTDRKYFAEVAKYYVDFNNDGKFNAEDLKTATAQQKEHKYTGRYTVQAMDVNDRNGLDKASSFEFTTTYADSANVELKYIDNIERNKDKPVIDANVGDAVEVNDATLEAVQKQFYAVVAKGTNIAHEELLNTFKATFTPEVQKLFDERVVHDFRPSLDMNK